MDKETREVEGDPCRSVRHSTFLCRVLIGNGSSKDLKESMSEEKTAKNLYRPFKSNRFLPCGCEEKEEVDSRSGFYVWVNIKNCGTHQGNES